MKGSTAITRIAGIPADASSDAAVLARFAEFSNAEKIRLPMTTPISLTVEAVSEPEKSVSRDISTEDRRNLLPTREKQGGSGSGEPEQQQATRSLKKAEPISKLYYF